jgi:hypothetical protein
MSNAQPAVLGMVLTHEPREGFRAAADRLLRGLASVALTAGSAKTFNERSFAAARAIVLTVVAAMRAARRGPAISMIAEAVKYVRQAHLPVVLSKA